MIILLFLCDTPDGNDVLLTSLPTSIPESDRLVASRIFAYLYRVYIHASLPEHFSAVLKTFPVDFTHWAFPLRFEPYR